MYSHGSRNDNLGYRGGGGGGGGGGGNRMGRGSGGDRERRGGGGRGGGGRGGGRFGGRGRGPGYAGRHEQGPEPGSRFQVKTNCFLALYPKSPDAVWYKYSVEIVPKRRIKESDRVDGALPAPESIPDAHPKRVKGFQDKIKEKGPNVTSQAVLRKLSMHLWKNHNLCIVTDGARMSFSPSMLFDDGTEKTYHIICDNIPYSITLTRAGEVPLGALSQVPRNDSERNTISSIVQAVATMFKHSLGSNLKTIPKSPNTFYLNENSQSQVLRIGSGGSMFPEYYTNSSTIAPHVGMVQSVRYSDKGELIVAVNNKLNFLNRENYATAQNKRKELIPLLNTEKKTFAGIYIQDLHNKIRDPDIRKSIENELKGQTFTVTYTKGDGWAQHQREAGRSEGYVERCRTFTKHGQKMYHEEIENRIKWSCYDETFSKRQGEEEVTYNVATYFKKIYDFDIRFPNMPIVSTCRGFYPAEFLFQELSLVKNMNDPKFVKQALEYNDRFAGIWRMDHIKTVKNIANTSKTADNMSLEEMLEKFSISVDRNPVPVEATRLKAPSLKFGGNNMENRTHDGSWNLNQKIFSRCAPLFSYAVIDMGKDNNGMPAIAFMDKLFQNMVQSHGFRLENGCGHLLPHLIVREEYSDPAQLHRLFQQAVLKARALFVEDAFKNRRRFGFLTNAIITYYCWKSRRPETTLAESLVTRFPNMEDEGAPIYAIPTDRTKPTHCIVHRQTGNEKGGRIQFMSRSKGKWIDPMELESIDDIADIGYTIPDSDFPDDVHSASEAEPNPKPIHMLQDHQYECPSIVFAYLPEKRTDIYDCIKLLSDLEFDVNTQCIVQAKCSSQKNIGQYCSNVALKVNTKLFSFTNDAIAWELENPLPWVGDEPRKTMVMGYSMSHGYILGKEATVVAGSVSLLKPMQMAQAAKIYCPQERTDVVNAKSLMELVQTLARNFWVHTNDIPRYLLVYRDGGSDGSFDRIAEVELNTIRRAFSEINSGGKCNYNCNGENPDCESCMPPKITFVVAQRDHNICVVPANEVDAVKMNVPSGTLIDNTITNFSPYDDTFDFLLTPQCGLKGTSKPMYYRVIRNENKSCLTREKLYQLTYNMSFQYGTATKAPRKVPVLLNSDRLAKRVINYGGYLSHLTVANLYVNEDGDVVRRDEMSEVLGDQLFAASYGCFDKRVEGEYKPPFRPHITG